MMESLKRHALQQSVQFQQAAQTEQQSLAGAAKVEIEASRQELILAQSRFQEASSQQNTQINLLKNALSHAEARDGAVREDLLALRSQSESYSHLLERAEHNWQLMQAETRTADQLVRMQRSELTTALQELTDNKCATNELHGQLAALQHAQADATAECKRLSAELNAEHHSAPGTNAGPQQDKRHGERILGLEKRLDEFKLLVEQTLSDVQSCEQSLRAQMSALEDGVGAAQAEIQDVSDTAVSLQEAEGARREPGVPSPP